MREVKYFSVLVTAAAVFCVLCHGQSSNNRLSRRQRILSILESYQEPTAPTFHSARFNFEGNGRSGVASDRAISHYSRQIIIYIAIKRKGF